MTNVIPNTPEGPALYPHRVEVRHVGHDGHLTIEAALDQTAMLIGAPQDRFLTVDVSAPSMKGVEVPRPLNVAVVMDISGSMSARGKLDYAKEAAKVLVSSLHPEDVFSLTTFADEAYTIVPAQQVTDGVGIRKAIELIYEGGGTNLAAGIQQGIHEVGSRKYPNHIKRLVLLSDGHATIGIKAPNALKQYASKASHQNISLSAIGLGLDFNEELLLALADEGGGTYGFVEHPRNLQTAFQDELSRTKAIVSRGTNILIKPSPDVEILEFIGWNATKTEEGWNVHVGDFYAGDKRKIVVKVRVRSDSTEGPVLISTVQANYFDLLDGKASVEEALANGLMTSDASDVIAATNRDKSEGANKAYANWLLRRSGQAYAAGDLKKANDLAHQAVQTLKDAADNLDSPKLDEMAKEMEATGTTYQTVAPASVEGQRVIKSNDYKTILEMRSQ